MWGDDVGWNLFFARLDPLEMGEIGEREIENLWRVFAFSFIGESSEMVEIKMRHAMNSFGMVLLGNYRDGWLFCCGNHEG
jgi:hypothetical protein